LKKNGGIDMFKRFKKWLLHKHGYYTFIANIYGDPINLLNGRSIWQCHCGKLKFQNYLYHKRDIVYNIPELPEMIKQLEKKYGSNNG
jgi:hypothetical protein